mmetsp:Transcript_23311/g.78741  ORF Transcript_23311/g.78741 Transcript_23311/m.78741 type:complete len:210 (+) Transcript_23311:660-1289(+)
MRGGVCRALIRPPLRRASGHGLAQTLVDEVPYKAALEPFVFPEGGPIRLQVPHRVAHGVRVLAEEEWNWGFPAVAAIRICSAEHVEALFDAGVHRAERVGGECAAALSVVHGPRRRLVDDEARPVHGTQLIRERIVHPRLVAGLVAEGPGDDARVSPVAQHHANCAPLDGISPRFMQTIRLFKQRRRIRLHAVRLDVGLVDDVEAGAVA